MSVGREHKVRKILLLAALLLAFGCLAGAGAEGSGYHSDFSRDTDGWYARSMGEASLSLEDGALAIAGRADDWNSPGRDFRLEKGETYALSVRVMQDEADAARFMISVAHTRGGVESYENLGSATAKKGEWTTVTGSYTAGDYERFVLYVETTGAPELSFRMKDFTLEGRVSEFGGEDIPALKDVCAGLFDFGTAVTGSEALNRQRMAFYASQFNIMTPGNELKPDFVLDVNASKAMATEDETAAVVRFDAVKPLLDFARENGVKVHGHVLVWHSQTPEVFFHEGYSRFKPLVSREVMLARLENYVKGIMEYLDENYPGVVVSWDVVNEAIDDGTGKLRASNWTKVVGDDFILRAFEIARKYAPEGTLLYYNDYNTALEPKQTGIVNLLQDLMAEGTVDGYGFQMHHDVRFPSAAQIKKSVERIAALGLRLRVSELDVTVGSRSDEAFEKQAAYYADVMAILLPYAEQIEAVQVWGVTDDLSWRASQYPLLFDAAAAPKPAFWAVVNAVKGE
uniref:Beta-xylanase n=1 Tax=uncultured bacterium Ad_010_C07 TaxID=1489291 RepID=A0A0B4N0R7_9BACT|nr:putative glycosyl hydrolase family 10 [uncultured bacterium Ad_010_C07]